MKNRRFYGNELSTTSDELKEVAPAVKETESEVLPEKIEDPVPEKEIVREGVAYGYFKTLNVRSTPSAKDDKNIIAQIENGRKVTIISDHDDFIFVKFDTGKGIGGEGYVMKKFIKEV